MIFGWINLIKDYKYMDQGYTHQNSGQASTDQISIELFSEHKLNQDIKASLAGHLTSKLPKAHDNRVLIIGGRVGITALLLLPYSNRIDVVVEPQYIPILEALANKRNVNYTFYREGVIGDKYSLPNLDTEKCKINVVEISKFHSAIHNENSYDVILLQNIIVHPQINIVKELMRLDHQVLITMIVPGKIVHQGMFELLSGIQENILHVFYDQEIHDRLEYVRYLSGRWQQINFWEIFIWKKKQKSLDSSKELKEIQSILEEEVKKNVIGQKIDKGKNYQSPETLAQYMEFDFGQQQYFGIKNFPAHCAQLVIAEASKRGLSGRAMDIGCALGRSTVELASSFSQVLGIDHSKLFIENAENILKQKYQNLVTKVKYQRGDACNLDESFGKFDVIFSGNLMDKLQDPEAFIKSIPKFLNENGIIVIASPYLWRKETTPIEKWIGGKVIDGKEVPTYHGLKKLMESHGLKEIRDCEDVRFVHKENPWVFAYVSSHVTYWGRT